MKLSEFARYDPTDNVTQIVLEALAHFAKPYAKTRVLELDDNCLPFVDESVNGTFQFNEDGIKIKGTGPNSGFTINPKSLGTGTNYGLFNTWGHSKITLEDFAIDGQRAAIIPNLKSKIGNSFLYVADGSAQTKMRGITMFDLADTVDGEGFACMVSGKATDFVAEDCNISGIAGTAFNLCGSLMKVARCTIKTCDWNSLSVFGGNRVHIHDNFLIAPKKRNVNMENNAQYVSVLDNLCDSAGYANVGNYGNVDAVLISGNTLIAAGTGATFKVGEIDLAGTGRFKIGVNFYSPKAGGFKLSTTGVVPNILVADPEGMGTVLKK